MTALQSLSDDLAAAVDRVSASLVAIHARRRIPASGILWQPGVVVTNHHVIQREDGITVTLPDGSSVDATLAGRDSTTDIAVLRLARAVGTPATWEATPLRIGQLVVALGRPGPAVTAALGMVSTVGGPWRTWSGGRVDALIGLDVAVYDGFSGGPLLNAAGAVVGMNSSALSRGSAMTLPVTTVTRVAEQLLSGGHVRRGFLGLGLQIVRLPASRAAQLTPVRDVGLMVVSLDEHGPASNAGVQLGDVVLAFDDDAATEPGEILSALTGDRIGQPLTLSLLRGGQLVHVKVVIGERPAQRSRSA